MRSFVGAAVLPEIRAKSKNTQRMQGGGLVSGHMGMAYWLFFQTQSPQKTLEQQILLLLLYTEDILV